MSGIRSITRRPTAVGVASDGSVPIYVDSDDNILKMIPAGSGTTEVQVVDASSVQTLTNKTMTAPTQNSPVIVTPSGVVVALEAAFTQVAGNKTHTAAFTVPAGATILDILITNTVVWNSGTSATMKVGTTGDDDCFFTALDLKTIPAAGKSINFAWPGGAEGASVPAIDGGSGNGQLGATNGFLYSLAGQTVNAIVTDVNVAGANGRTRVTLIYSLPSSVIAPVVA